MTSYSYVIVKRLLPMAKFVDGLLKAALFTSLLAIGPIFSAPLAQAVKIPSDLIGKWEVSEVHRNTQSSQTFHYGWNSSLLMWRIFDFKVSDITSNTPEKKIYCPKPVAIAEDVNLAQALNAIFSYENGMGGSILAIVN